MSRGRSTHNVEDDGGGGECEDDGGQGEEQHPLVTGPGSHTDCRPATGHTQRRTTFLLILYSNYSTTTYAQHSGITGTIFV